VNTVKLRRPQFRFPDMREVGGNLIHPSATIGADVKLGRGNFIGPGAVVVGNVRIGDDNWIGPHVTIGTAAQYHGPRNEWKEADFLPIRIGNGNTLREYVSVHEPTEHETAIEDDCYLMAYNHVSHDTRLCSKVTLANNVQIGGFSELGHGCVIGLSTTIHQFTTIGAFVMVGMSSVVVKDLPPFTKWAGNPVRYLGVNTVGLSRNGFSDPQIEAMTAALSGGAEYAGPGIEHIEAFRARNARTHRDVAPVAPQAG
jgi:UDP-N-acetylglucosamine acyltransferase